MVSYDCCRWLVVCVVVSVVLATESYLWWLLFCLFALSDSLGFPAIRCSSFCCVLVLLTYELNMFLRACLTSSGVLMRGVFLLFRSSVLFLFADPCFGRFGSPSHSPSLSFLLDWPPHLTFICWLSFSPLKPLFDSRNFSSAVMYRILEEEVFKIFCWVHRWSLHEH